MSLKKVLVTGGAGYIGAHTVVELMNNGWEPVIVDDLSRSSMVLLDGVEKIVGKKPVFFKVDCNDYQGLLKVVDAHPEITSVIHFAAYKSVNESVTNPLIYYQNNIGSMVTLLRVMKERTIAKIVFSSSCTVYGQPDHIPVKESAPFKRAESAYGATKQICERILEDQSVARPSLNIISLRYFNPIGAHSSGLIGELPIGVPTNLVPFITQTAIGKRSALTVFGNDYDTPDGSCLRDFIHVVDLAKAHVKALENIESQKRHIEAFNIGSGIPVSVLELINTFKKVTGVSLNYKIGPRREGDIEKVYADCEKSLSMLHWKTALSIEDALRDAWNWEKMLLNATH